MGDLPCKSNKTLYHEACNHWFYTKLCHEHHVIKIMQLKTSEKNKTYWRNWRHWKWHLNFRNVLLRKKIQNATVLRFFSVVKLLLHSTFKLLHPGWARIKIIILDTLFFLRKSHYIYKQHRLRCLMFIFWYIAVK